MCYRELIKSSTTYWNCSTWHFSRLRPFKKYKWAKCRVTGHKEGFFKRNKPSSHYRMPKRISYVNPWCSRKYLSISVNECIMTLQLDTTSDVFLLCRKTWQELSWLSIHSTNDCVKSAPSIPIKISGIIKCIVKFSDSTVKSKCYVTNVSSNLLGLDRIAEFENVWLSI